VTAGLGWGFRSFVLFFCLLTCSAILSSLSHPHGGGEFHTMFAYSGGGRFGAALRVFTNYVGGMSAAAFVLVLSRLRFHWAIIAGLASVVCLLRWWHVCHFPYQNHLFHLGAMALLPIIPIPIFAAALAADRFVRRRRDWRRPGGTVETPGDAL